MDVVNVIKAHIEEVREQIRRAEAETLTLGERMAGSNKFLADLRKELNDATQALRKIEGSEA